MKRSAMPFLLVLCLTASLSLADDGKHLFILSGQSNMVGLKPEVSFTPAVEKALGAGNVIVVKSAQGGQPIRRWYKAWQDAAGNAPADKAKIGDLYDKLMKAVNAEIADEKIATVTFVWMQGERDAKESHGEVYGESFKGLVEQIETDLKREHVNVVIGRLSDFDNDNKRYPHWTKVREQQVAVAEADERIEWVDTDDLNGEKDGLHYTKDGYKTLGERFAEKAVGLVEKETSASK